MGLLVLAVLADLSRDRHQRGAVGGGVGDAELHVDGARPQRGRHHCRAAGDPPVHLGHERRGLLVAGEHVADLRRTGQRVDEVDVLLAGNAEDQGDALGLKALDHQLCGRAHRRPPAPASG